MQLMEAAARAESKLRTTSRIPCRWLRPEISSSMHNYMEVFGHEAIDRDDTAVLCRGRLQQWHEFGDDSGVTKEWTATFDAGREGNGNHAPVELPRQAMALLADSAFWRHN